MGQRVVGQPGCACVGETERGARGTARLKPGALEEAGTGAELVLGCRMGGAEEGLLRARLWARGQIWSSLPSRQMRKLRLT